MRADITAARKFILNSLRIIESHKWVLNVMEIFGIQDTRLE